MQTVPVDPNDPATGTDLNERAETIFDGFSCCQEESEKSRYIFKAGQSK